MGVRMVRSVLLTLALAASALAFTAQPVWCQQGCVATFCGASVECPGACVCAIPMGEATGHCAGTR